LGAVNSSPHFQEVNMASGAKIWIVSRLGWEYDDSCYYRPESDGSQPVAAFTFPELARQICNEKNIAEVRSLGTSGFSDYVDRWDMDLQSEGSTKFLEDNFLDENFEFIRPVSEISDEILLRVMDFANISFFEVIEVDLLA
jgi:hypothetical protein